MKKPVMIIISLMLLMGSAYFVHTTNGSEQIVESQTTHINEAVSDLITTTAYGQRAMIATNDVIHVISTNYHLPPRLVKARVSEEYKDKESVTMNEARAIIASFEDLKFADRVPIITYHHLLKRDENRRYRGNSLVMSVEMFEEHMKLLHENNYTTITLDELALFMSKQIQLPENSIVITFDDGYLSNFEYGYPILKQYGFKATIFIITGIVRERPIAFHPNYLSFISWPEMETYKDVFEYAGHTHDLHYKEGRYSHLRVKPQQSVLDDLKQSKELLDSDYFAYPYGQYSKKVIRTLEEAGYTHAFTVEPKPVTVKSDPYKIPRYMINPTTKLKRFKKYVGID
ncbi:hypothetical protein BHU72_04550 [Desulfuribacillus stibiiarsenatis]|uniref:NodB homology domain-containing protein n=1 Tax=Desulfuribacillus stibiiarsenatis TaxID=1390249 RepID=A0A1E5L5E5_9FIRM|nr:polysaccharide deacetylase family protein [Desulfuribacillus stibiiarsenatis]OEH85367.1 hypothetical protein BHU72_04550 [Desulfuribacillus stibiiarsenatis]